MVAHPPIPQHAQCPPPYETHRRRTTTVELVQFLREPPPPYSLAPPRSKTLHHKNASVQLAQLAKLAPERVAYNACPHCCFHIVGKSLKTWFVVQKKPYTAITVHIERLTGEEYEENDLSGIVDLVEVIRIQDTGPAEAARAIRKKLKYGNMHRQLRALTILDGLIQNAGTRFQRTFADGPLLERLRMMPQDEMVDPDVRAKCNVLFRQWAVAYKNTQGLNQIASLYKQLPQTKRPHPSQSKVIRETEAEAAREMQTSPPTSPAVQHRSSPSSSTPSASWQPQRPIQLASTERSSSLFKSKDKKNKRKPFNLEKEKGQLLETIASASVASTNLLNALKLINRESQRVSENVECKNRFDTCKVLRRQILRYIQLVESEQYIGSLLSANDELIKALMAYEVMDKSIDDDSDSEAEYQASKERFQNRMSMSGNQEGLAGLSLNDTASASIPPPRPPRPTSIPIPAPMSNAASKKKIQVSESEEDEDDPFADRNAVKTPYQEREGLSWKDV
ncbi:hypothetical protein EJ06DRAFT_558050 [Trichodelitschia bisporula]|uniref:VHS domain-containing protein n=1 Tax=Trichodelitschia bisporula TaxID=703511 RepID=A0A6G1HSJ5_9PEZI|nr:hypothetical protein EJ06DRAFT_558050 [Trichodelitschia bisporula]